MSTLRVCLAFVLLAAGAAPLQAQGLNPVGALSFALDDGGLYGGTSDAALALFKQQATTLPIGTSSGGFTWTFDRVLGIAVRQSDSFGSMFTDRPFTVGRRSFSIGVTTQHTKWKSLAGQSLAGGDLYARYRYSDNLFTRDVLPVEELYQTFLDLQTDRTAISAVYGVTSRFDLAAVVPFGRTAVDATSESSYTIVSTGKRPEFERTSYSAAAAGMADTTIRGKYHVLSKSRLDLAASGELRLPTGDPDKLLGTGKLQESISILGSSSVRGYSPHFAVGYVNAGHGFVFEPVGKTGQLGLTSVEPSDEITYAAGVDTAWNKRLTIAADVLGRTMTDSVHIVRIVTTSPGEETTLYKAQPGSVTMLLGTAGAKFAFGDSWLLTGSVLFSLSDQGLAPGLTPVIGFERAF